jgi:NAD(P)-dependent dehydrogenase (short-subunit alcohol dehydrogenase family)
VARHFLASGVAGRIVNVSSLSSKRGKPLHAAYSMSKFAMNSLTQVLAGELGPHGITVNAICPGWVDTGRFNLNEKIRAQQTGTSEAEQHRMGLEVQAKNNVQGRIAVAEDIAGIVAFLVSPEGVHISGQAINVDGGELFH